MRRTLKDHLGGNQDRAAEWTDLARQKLTLDHQRAQIEQRIKTLRERLLDLAEEYGTSDHHGHQHIPLTAEIRIGDKTYTGLTRRRSTRKQFREDKARVLAERKGILERVLRTETVTYVDQDELWACQQQGLITAQEIDELIETTETYSLWGQ